MGRLCQGEWYTGKTRSVAPSALWFAHAALCCLDTPPCCPGRCAIQVGPSASTSPTRGERTAYGAAYGAAGTDGEMALSTRATCHGSLPARRGGVRRLYDPGGDAHPPRSHPRSPCP